MCRLLLLYRIKDLIILRETDSHLFGKLDIVIVIDIHHRINPVDIDLRRLTRRTWHNLTITQNVIVIVIPVVGGVVRPRVIIIPHRWTSCRSRSTRSRHIHRNFSVALYNTLDDTLAARSLRREHSRPDITTHHICFLHRSAQSSIYLGAVVVRHRLRERTARRHTHGHLQLLERGRFTIKETLPRSDNFTEIVISDTVEFRINDVPLPLLDLLHI